MNIGPYSSSLYNFPWTASIENVDKVLPYVTPPGPGRGGTIGQVPDAAQDALGGRLSSPVFMTASLLGSGIGGALVGYVASNRSSGALTAGAFTASLAALSDAVLAYREEKPVAGVLFALGGMFGLGFVVLRFAEQGGHPLHGVGCGKNGLGCGTKGARLGNAHSRPLVDPPPRFEYKVQWPNGHTSFHMAPSTQHAVVMSEFYFNNPKGKPKVWVEYMRSTGRSYTPQWRRLQGSKR